LTEVRTVETSAGAGDANKVPNTNASGVLDPTVINAKNTSAGAGDAGKVPLLNASGVLAASIVNSVATSAGAGDSGKLAALDGSGRLDSSFLPVGVGADTATVQASENLAAGDYVNLHNSGGARVRKADASNGRRADGFVLASVTSASNATVYFEGQNTGVTGKTPGAVQYLSATTAGATTETAPTTAGQIMQVLGVAVTATVISTECEQPITLA
jgi:hypothetical protein